MADFCQQCSIEQFGEDFKDLAGLGGNSIILEEGRGYLALCEGCGSTLVDNEGRCIDHNHNHSYNDNNRRADG